MVANKEEVKFRYTYDKNNKLYDKNWILNHFDEQEVNLINNQIQENRKNTTNKIKKQAKYIGSFIIFVWLIVLIIFGIIYFG